MNTEKHNRSCVAGKKFGFTGALRRLRVVVFFSPYDSVPPFQISVGIPNKAGEICTCTPEKLC